MKLALLMTLLLGATAMASDNPSDPEETFDIFGICRQGDYLAAVNFIDAHCPNLQEKNKEGLSPLLIALHASNFALAQLLFERGAYDAEDEHVKNKLVAIGKLLLAGQEREIGEGHLYADSSHERLLHVAKMHIMNMRLLWSHRHLPKSFEGQIVKDNITRCSSY